MGEVQVGQTVCFWAWDGLVPVQRAGVVEAVILGCAGYVLRLTDGTHVPTSRLVRARQLSLFGD